MRSPIWWIGLLSHSEMVNERSTTDEGGDRGAPRAHQGDDEGSTPSAPHRAVRRLLHALLWRGALLLRAEVRRVTLVEKRRRRAEKRKKQIVENGRSCWAQRESKRRQREMRRLDKEKKI